MCTICTLSGLNAHARDANNLADCILPTLFNPFCRESGPTSTAHTHPMTKQVCLWDEFKPFASNPLLVLWLVVVGRCLVNMEVAE